MKSDLNSNYISAISDVAQYNEVLGEPWLPCFCGQYSVVYIKKNKKLVPYCRKHLIEYIYGSTGTYYKLRKERPTSFSDAVECIEQSKPGLGIWVSEDFRPLWSKNDR